MNSNLISVFVLALCALAINAQNSTCPRLTPAASFNLTAYGGKWYEIKRLPNLFEIFQNCITAEYSLIDPQSVKVKNTGYIKIFGLVIPLPSANGKAVQLNQTRPNELSVAFYGGANPTTPNYIVLDTDYVNYSLVYSCSGSSFFSSGKTEYAWILSRQRTLDASTVNRLTNVLNNLGVNTSKFITTDQNC